MLIESESTREAICDLVERVRPDVLVIGTRGLSGVQKWVLLVTD